MQPAADAVGRGAAVTALPNLLSLGRIALVPVVVVVLMWTGPVARGIAGFLFLVACITDFFDGWLARRRRSTTVLGQFLDPMADKLLVVGSLVMLTAHGPDPRVPAWMVVVVALREIAVTGLRGIASRSGVIVPADELGKYKMIFQIFAVEGLIVHYAYGIPGIGVVDFHAAGMRFMWVAIVMTVWSAVDYHVRVLRQIRLD